MCWNYEVSIFTFVLGTIFNLRNFRLYSHVKSIMSVSVLWEWVLLMQLFDALAWKTHDLPEKKLENKYAAKGAFIANVMQPIIVGITMLLAAGPEVMFNHKVAASVVLVGYIIWNIYAANYIDEVTRLAPGTKCGNMVYDWWNKFPGGAKVYIVSLVLIMALLLKPVKFAWYNIAFILATLALSAVFYSCGVGSVWCWFAAFAPLIMVPMYKMSGGLDRP